MNIALDVESVLAEPNEAVARTTDRLTLDDIESTWFSDTEDSENYQIYMGVSDAIWRHNPQIIPPEEPNLSEYVDDIRREVDQLDIVTHRQHVDEQVAWWLAEHDIRYDRFVSLSEPKCDRGYSLYIDDNPNMVGSCPLLLRHQPWNAHIDTESMRSCHRIHSLVEVLDFL